nr:IclR family transcriptional regulator C-terminal domain-containing protein [Fodinicola feengrottensis]
MDSADVRAQGWAETIGERATGVASISAPIRVHGELVAALCLSGPLSRFAPHPSTLHPTTVVAAAHQLETAMR